MLLKFNQLLCNVVSSAGWFGCCQESLSLFLSSRADNKSFQWQKKKKKLERKNLRCKEHLDHDSTETRPDASIMDGTIDDAKVTAAPQELLQTLTSSLQEASTALPNANTTADSGPSVIPPTNGLSLLDTKSEIFLSYLQNLSFLTLLNVESLEQSGRSGEGEKVDGSLFDKTMFKLNELRVYLERGIKPLESRLKYQVDKVLNAADDEARDTAMKKAKKTTRKIRNVEKDSDEDSEESESGEGSDSEDGSDATSASDEEDIDELAFRPNVSAFARGLNKEDDRTSQNPSSKPTAASSDAIYRPPRVKPVVMPEEHPDSRKTSKRSEREAKHAAKSRVIDEYVQGELNSAPLAQPSIGTTIRDGGRAERSAAERAREKEKRDYEEGNFVRLPKESKKERSKKKGAQGGGGMGTFAGEDWKGLGESADRIASLTKRGRNTGGALERSRKRRPADDLGARNGSTAGEGFEKRRKKVAGYKK